MTWCSADVILDAVGGQTLVNSLDRLAYRGRCAAALAAQATSAIDRYWCRRGNGVADIRSILCMPPMVTA